MRTFFDLGHTSDIDSFKRYYVLILVNFVMDHENSSDGSSSDDGSDKARNIHCLLVESQDNHQNLDENYAYKRKLGDLIFDANFEAGNLASVEQIDEFEYDLMVRPDVANPNYKCWFNFTITNQKPNQSIVLTIINLTGELANLFHQGFTPVIRTRKQPNWCRLHPDQVFYHKSRQHNEQFVLSLAFKFTDCNNEHQFALFYPYSLTTLTSFINRWQVELKRARNLLLASKKPAEELRRKRGVSRKALDPASGPAGPRFIVDILSESFLLKPIFKLSITSGIQLDEPSKPRIFLIRQTSGNFECQTSLICQGFIDFMLCQDPVAQLGRQLFDSIVLPMLDPDSICAGNSRTDLFGQLTLKQSTLNDQQGQYSTLYEGLVLARQLIDRELVCSKADRRIIIIDLRMNPYLIGSRLVGFHYENSFRMESHLRLARLLSRFSDGFYLERCKWIQSDLRTGSRAEVLDFDASNVSKSLPNVDQYRLEVSPFAYYERSLTERSYKDYTREKYLLLGKSLVYSLVELFRCRLVASKQTEPNLLSQVFRVLESFHLDSNDIDDVTLDFRRKL